MAGIDIINSTDYLTISDVETIYHIKRANQAKLRMAKNQNPNNPFLFSKIGKIILYKRSDIENFINGNIRRYDENGI
ncbi:MULTISPECIES: hypothetical protein [Campylobacter]|uniref:DNA-binding protein n=1 Tax=Campylobacter lanienae TaxID=75658 RepID=A0ABY3G7R9_9BACT|nr:MULTISPECIES: hypothetical protein [Campylobacter]TWO28877.1 DNA-binding protein [Campylobacter lanienae]